MEDTEDTQEAAMMAELYDEVCMDCGALMSEHRVSPPFCRPDEEAPRG